LKLNTSLSLELRMATPADFTGKGRSSHMCRTAKYLLGCISLAYPGFRPAKGKLQGNKPKMEKLPPGHTDTVVLDLISNVAFMGITEDGLLMPVLRAGEGSFHISSTLATAPPPHYH
jgi:hypothetical protein